MNTTQDGNPPVNPTRYTKELHLQHVQAFWEGNLEYCPIAGTWVKAVQPPDPASAAFNYRIKQPKQLRSWKPEEFPLGAWVRLKGSQDISLAVASCKGFIVWLDRSGQFVADHINLFQDFEHSTDQGKTWLPCGVEE